MANSADSSGRGWFRLRTATAVGLGIVLGGVVRDLPIAVSSFVWLRASRRRRCDGEALECAAAAVPDVIDGLIVFGLLVVLVALAGATAGAVLVARGLPPSKPAGADARGVARESSDGHPAVGLVRVMVGTALAVPAVWLLASFLAVVVDS